MSDRRIHVQTVAQEITASFTKAEFLNLPGTASELKTAKVHDFTSEVIELEKGLLVRFQSRLSIAYVESETKVEKYLSHNFIQNSYIVPELKYVRAGYQTSLAGGSELCFILASPKEIMVKPNIAVKIRVLTKNSLPLRDLSYFDNAVHIYTDSKGRLSAPKIGTIRIEVD